MGQNQARPWVQYEVKHRKEGWKDCERPKPNTDLTRQAQIRIDFEKKGPIERQIALEVTRKEIISDIQPIRTDSAAEEARERPINLEIIKQHNFESKNSKNWRGER